MYELQFTTPKKATESGIWIILYPMNPGVWLCRLVYLCYTRGCTTQRSQPNFSPIDGLLDQANRCSTWRHQYVWRALDELFLSQWFTGFVAMIEHTSIKWLIFCLCCITPLYCMMPLYFMTPSIAWSPSIDHTPLLITRLCWSHAPVRSNHCIPPICWINSPLLRPSSVLLRTYYLSILSLICSLLMAQ